MTSDIRDVDESVVVSHRYVGPVGLKVSRDCAKWNILLAILRTGYDVRYGEIKGKVFDVSWVILEL